MFVKYEEKDFLMSFWWDNRAYTFPCPVAFQIYWNKRKCLHKKRVQLLQDWLRRRANARNVSLRISLRWPIHIINPFDQTKLSCNTPYRRSATVSFLLFPQEDWFGKPTRPLFHCFITPIWLSWRHVHTSIRFFNANHHCGRRSRMEVAP